jgi:hypothetical protein
MNGYELAEVALLMRGQAWANLDLSLCSCSLQARKKVKPVARQKICRRLTACKSLGATDAAGPSLRGPWKRDRRRRRYFSYPCLKYTDKFCSFSFLQEFI